MNQTLDIRTNGRTSKISIQQIVFQTKTSTDIGKIGSLNCLKLILFRRGKIFVVSLGDDLKGYHLVTFYLVNVFNNCVCGTDLEYILLWE